MLGGRCFTILWNIFTVIFFELNNIVPSFVSPKLLTVFQQIIMSIQNFFKRNRLNEEIAIAAGESNVTKHEETNVAKEEIGEKMTKQKGYGKYDESQRAEIGK